MVLGALAGWIGGDFALTGNGDSNAAGTTQRTRDATGRLTGNETGLSKAKLVAQKVVNNRMARASTRLISENEDVIDNPMVVMKEFTTLKEKIVTNLENQKERIYQDKSLLKMVGSGISSAGSSIVGGTVTAAKATWGFVSKIWSSEEVTAGEEVTEEQQLTQTEETLVAAIDEDIQAIKDEYAKVETAQTTFKDAIVAANTTMNTTSAEVAQGINLNNTKIDQINTEFENKALAPNTKTLKAEYEKAAATFNKQLKESANKIKEILEKDETNLGVFKSAVEKTQIELNNAADQAQTAAGITEYIDATAISTKITEEEARNKDVISNLKTEKDDAEDARDAAETAKAKYEKEAAETLSLLNQVMGLNDATSKRKKAKLERLKTELNATRDATQISGDIDTQQSKIEHYQDTLKEIDIKISREETKHKENIAKLKEARSATKAEEKALKYTLAMKDIVDQEIVKVQELIKEIEPFGIAEKKADEKLEDKIEAEVAAPATESETEVVGTTLTEELEVGTYTNYYNYKIERISEQEYEITDPNGVAVNQQISTLAKAKSHIDALIASQPTATSEKTECTKLGGTYEFTHSGHGAPSDKVILINSSTGSWKYGICYTLTGVTLNSGESTKMMIQTTAERRILSVINQTDGKYHATITNPNNPYYVQDSTKAPYNTKTLLISSLENDSFESTVLNLKTKLDQIEAGLDIERTAVASSTAQFLLTSTTATSTTDASSSSGILNQYTSQIMGTIAAWNSGSLLSGAVMAGLIELTQASDTLIDYSSSFTVGYVSVSGITLDQSDGVALGVGATTYDYDDFYTSTSGGAGYNVTSNTLATTYSLIEETELTFTNPSGLVSNTPYQPFEGVVTVSATENVYDEDYEYDTIKTADIARGNYEEDDSEWYEFWDVSSTEIADMEEEDLTVEEVRTITKDFHVLFNSYEYTTTITEPPIGNCTVGAKTGSTGMSAKPKVLLDWDWSHIAIDTCDESNSDYKYCDTTQFTTTLLKKVYEMKDFFQTNSLGQCPQAIDVTGSKTQDLSTTTLDVGVTQISATDTAAGAKLEIIVSTNNNLPMDIDLDVKAYEVGTTNVKASCSETQNITSVGTFYCDIDTSIAGSGTFDIVSTITPTLCTGCENNDSTNDVMNSQLIIGQSGVQDCLYYKTQKDYFEDVLAANGLLTSGDGQDMLDYLNFTVNLTRDGFSNDFKEDFDAYLNTFTTKPTTYPADIEELFKSNKFKITWPGKPGAWDAGKYNARIVIEFEEDNWTWNDANDIKEIEIILSGWQKPDVTHAIYDVGFNGLVGLDSDDGRVGYGAGYTQLSQDALTIVSGIEATPNPYSNALTEVNVDVDRDFYTMNTSRRGNVLTIKRSGSKVDLILSPSTAVPLLLDITRTSARDAYAYYAVEVDGQPQTTGSSLITWNGIGNGCVDFAGSGMGTWDNAPDAREGSGAGYGFFWSNAVAAGTASFYGTFYTPDNSSTVIYLTKQSEDALFTSDQGVGDLLTIDTSSGISSLKTVFDKVGNEEICVIGGEYFWNSGKVYQPIESEISSRTSTCMQIN
jgi:hypothetical protein